MQLKFKYNSKSGLNEIIKPDSSPLNHINFSVLNLKKKEVYSSTNKNVELGLVILSGSCSININNEDFKSLGKRRSVFDGPATGIYIPINSNYTISAKTDLEIAACSCVTDESFEVQVIQPEDIVINQRGKDGYEREVHNVLADNMKASKFLIGETFNRAGKWSSYPPHGDLTKEAGSEELFLFKINPEQGFGFQRIYTKDREIDETYTVENNDVIIKPYGFNPVSAPPGYDVYYLWFIAGKNRDSHGEADEDHGWISK